MMMEMGNEETKDKNQEQNQYDSVWSYLSTEGLFASKHGMK